MGLHSGYALYECSAACDYSAESGAFPGNRTSSVNVVFSAAYITAPSEDLLNNSKIKGSPNPDPEAWKMYYESRAFERKRVLDNDEKLKLKKSPIRRKNVTLGDKAISRALEYLYKKGTVEV